MIMTAIVIVRLQRSLNIPTLLAKDHEEDLLRDCIRCCYAKRCHCTSVLSMFYKLPDP